MLHDRDCYEVRKTLDSWVYLLTGVEADDGKTTGERESLFKAVQRKIQIDVVAVKKLRRTGTPPFPLVSADYEVSCKDPAFTFTGTDLERLRAVAFAEVDKSQTIVWEKFLVVSVESAHCYEHLHGEGFALGYVKAERGTLPDGMIVRRVTERYAHRSGRIEVWPDEWKDKFGNILALLPDTKEVREQLDAAQDKIKSLQRQIAIDFSFPKVSETLSSLDSRPYFITARNRVRQAV